MGEDCWSGIVGQKTQNGNEWQEVIAKLASCANLRLGYTLATYHMPQSVCRVFGKVWQRYPMMLPQCGYDPVL